MSFILRKMVPTAHTNLTYNLHQAVQELSRQSQAPSPQDVPILQNASLFVHRAISVIKQFCRYKHPTFDGGSDPLVVEEWIRGLKRIMCQITCTNTHKVQCTKFMFVGLTNHCQESTSCTRIEEQQFNLTWVILKIR